MNVLPTSLSREGILEFLQIAGIATYNTDQSTFASRLYDAWRAGFNAAKQPAPSIGLSILDAAEAIQGQANGARIGLILRVTLRKPDGTPAELRSNVEVTAWADSVDGFITAGAYSLPGILGAMTHELNKRQ